VDKTIEVTIPYTVTDKKPNIFRKIVRLWLKLKLWIFSLRIRRRLRSIAKDEVWLNKVLSKSGASRQFKRLIERKGYKYKYTGNMIMNMLDQTSKKICGGK